jgi:hypothetical protein
MGENVFRSAIKNYQTDPAVIYGFARTTDLKRNLEQASGLNLTGFFNKWFSGQGYPTYNVQWSNLGSGNVWIKMNQVTSHPSVSFFDLPVALKFTNATQNTTVIVNNIVNGEIFIKPIGFVADTVFIDPDAWLITRNNTTQKLPAVLPVILQSFIVSKNGCVASINFSTSFESDMASFDIEFSNDGAVYSKAATITATGNSNTEKNYNYHFPMQPGRNYFFRLKMIERDGSFTYSAVSVQTNCSATVTGILITPNPVKNKITISGLPAGKTTLMIYGMKGQLVQTIYSVADFVTIDISTYASGIYLLRIQDANGNWTTEKVVKE